MTLVFWISAGLLTYTLIVYPALMWLASLGCRRATAAAPFELPTVTLIIPAHNEEVVLAAKLANTQQLAYPTDKLDVLVVSDGSSDRTCEIAKQSANAGIRLLDLQPNRGKASALNAGVAESRGDVLCLCDANVMFRPDALSRMVQRLADPAVGAVSGDVQLASDESDFEAGESGYYSIERRLQLGESWLGSMMGVDGGMYVIRRELFKMLPADTLLDDFATSMNVLQQGKKIAYEPAATATENGTPSWRQEFRRRVRVNHGAFQSVCRGLWPLWSRPVELWQYVSHKPLRWFGPIWLVMLLVSSAALWNAGWFYRAALIGQVLFYVAAGLAWVSPGVRAHRFCGLAFYFTMSHVAMFVGLWKGMFTRPTGVWQRTERSPVAALRTNPPDVAPGENEIQTPSPRTVPTASATN